MYYDTLLILLKKSHSKVDKIGNDESQYTESKAYGGELSVTQSEFYSAASQQFKPERVIEIWDRDYNGEERCKLPDGKVYEIYRSFFRAKDARRELYLRLPGNEYQH